MNPLPTDPSAAAFPETRWDDLTRQEVQWMGLTKREEFAKAAMQGLLADPEDRKCLDGCTCAESVAVWAVMHADNLIRALNGEIPGARVHCDPGLMTPDVL